MRDGPRFPSAATRRQDHSPKSVGPAGRTRTLRITPAVAESHDAFTPR
jgi:hypothetical protein